MDEADLSADGNPLRSKRWKVGWAYGYNHVAGTVSMGKVVW